MLCRALISFQSFSENQTSPIEKSFLLTVGLKDGIMLVARWKKWWSYPGFFHSIDEIGSAIL